MFGQKSFHAQDSTMSFVLKLRWRTPFQSAQSAQLAVEKARRQIRQLDVELDLKQAAAGRYGQIRSGCRP